MVTTLLSFICFCLVYFCLQGGCARLGAWHGHQGRHEFKAGLEPTSSSLMCHVMCILVSACDGLIRTLILLAFHHHAFLLFVIASLVYISIEHYICRDEQYMNPTNKSSPPL